MKIPKYSDIESDVKSLSEIDLYDLTMMDMATHKVKETLEDLVVYIKKSGFDLSKELLSIAHHPDSLKVFVSVARKITTLQDNKVYDNIKNEVSDDDSFDEADEEPLYTDSQQSYESEINEVNNRLIKMLKSDRLDGINAVLITKDGNMIDVSIEAPYDIGQSYLGLDILKNRLRKSYIKFMRGNHGDSGPGSNGGNVPKSPTGPTHDNPVDQADLILKNL